MVNVGLNVKNQIIRVLVRLLFADSTCNCECNKTCEINEYLVIKNCSCEKRLFVKLVLIYEDEVLNTTETSVYDKKVKKV